jgi:hypothetical protein
LDGGVRLTLHEREGYRKPPDASSVSSRLGLCGY